MAIKISQLPGIVSTGLSLSDLATIVDISESSNKKVTLEELKAFLTSEISVTQQVHTTGTGLTVNNATTWLIVNPTTQLSGLTVTLQPQPYDGQVIEISFGGTINSGVVVSGFNLLPNVTNDQDLLPTVVTTTIFEAGESISYRYKSSNKTWYRRF